MWPSNSAPPRARSCRWRMKLSPRRPGVPRRLPDETLAGVGLRERPDVRLVALVSPDSVLGFTPVLFLAPREP